MAANQNSFLLFISSSLPTFFQERIDFFFVLSSSPCFFYLKRLCSHLDRYNICMCVEKAGASSLPDVSPHPCPASPYCLHTVKWLGMYLRTTFLLFLCRTSSGSLVMKVCLHVHSRVVYVCGSEIHIGVRTVSRCVRGRAAVLLL